jgi:hypothetical protein
VSEGSLRRGLHGCPLCDEPPPHEHRLPTILNSLYYCPSGDEHSWRERRWRRPVCDRCGERQRKGAQT